MKKISIVIIMCIVLPLVLAGCGGTPQITRPQPAEGAETFEIEGECEAELSGDVLKVSGSSNLMDGTNGIISVLNSDGTTAAKQKFTKEGDSVSHEFAVEDEWEGVVYGFITFDTENADKQPKEVTEVYGKKFENFTGDSSEVMWNAKGVMAVFRSEPVEITRADAE